MKCLCYTVNDEETAQNLLALGIDGIITDRVDALGPGRSESRL
jgi:glycerophosphoryl diester phosphodiesterase